MDEYPPHSLAALVCVLVVGNGCTERDCSGGSSNGSGSHSAGGSVGSGVRQRSWRQNQLAWAAVRESRMAAAAAAAPAPHGRWWRLAVRAVQAEMDRGDDRIEPTLTLKQVFVTMAWRGAPLDTGALGKWAASQEQIVGLCRTCCRAMPRWIVRSK